MKQKVLLMDEIAVGRALTRLSFEIIEKNKNPENIVLVGIKTRGVPMAKSLAERIEDHGGPALPVCELDITFYRDDLSKLYDMPEVKSQDLSVDINGKNVILVDDVIYTGRTIRAAIDAIFSNGRPAKIGLAVLIDRGHRELPIKPDYVGKNVPTSRREVVKVAFNDIDGVTEVGLYDMED